MQLLNSLDARGLLPPGRYAATLDEVEEDFVRAKPFVGSATRDALWREWEQHRVIIESAVGFIERIWLAGSFVSGKVDPADIDVIYGLDIARYAALSAEDRSYLEDCLELSWCRQHEMRVDAYSMMLFAAAPDGHTSAKTLDEDGRIVYAGIGLYDEYWQRAKDGDADGRRGYVEVLFR